MRARLAASAAAIAIAGVFFSALPRPWQGNDASLSYSRHSQGTFSHHHGVRYWFK
ncbi:hypothetical protein [Streptomyces sp. NPDC007206]|uniref:hypothetical protein n=1 Tax=Streptomyces sp. NPDC007206 TaxID=3154317 RepID=UPI0034026A32